MISGIWRVDAHRGGVLGHSCATLLSHRYASEALDTCSHLWPNDEDRFKAAIDEGLSRDPGDKAGGHQLTYAIELSSKLPWAEVLATATVTAILVVGGIVLERSLARRQRLAELYLDLRHSRDSLVWEIQWSLFREPPDPQVRKVDLEASFSESAERLAGTAATGVVACVGTLGARDVRQNWAAWRRRVLDNKSDRARLLEALGHPIKEPAGVDRSELESPTQVSQEKINASIQKLRDGFLDRLNNEHPSTLKPWVLQDPERLPEIRERMVQMDGVREVRRTLILGWIDEALHEIED